MLGFEKRIDNRAPDGARFLTVGLPDDEHQVVLGPGTPGKGQARTGRVAAAFIVDTDDCSGDFARLKALGVKFEEEAPVDSQYALFATLVDPAGNRVVIREPRPR